MQEPSGMSETEHQPTYKIGDRVRVAGLITPPSDFGADRYHDKIGKVGVVHDVSSTMIAGVDVYSLRFDGRRGSILLHPFYADELEAVQ